MRACQTGGEQGRREAASPGKTARPALPGATLGALKPFPFPTPGLTLIGSIQACRSAAGGPQTAQALLRSSRRAAPGWLHTGQAGWTCLPPAGVVAAGRRVPALPFTPTAPIPTAPSPPLPPLQEFKTAAAARGKSYLLTMATAASAANLIGARAGCCRFAHGRQRRCCACREGLHCCFRGAATQQQQQQGAA